MTYKEALEEQKRMNEFRDKHYTNISKPQNSPKTNEDKEFNFFRDIKNAPPSSMNWTRKNGQWQNAPYRRII